MGRARSRCVRTLESGFHRRRSQPGRRYGEKRAATREPQSADQIGLRHKKQDNESRPHRRPLRTNPHPPRRRLRRSRRPDVPIRRRRRKPGPHGRAGLGADGFVRCEENGTEDQNDVSHKLTSPLRGGRKMRSTAKHFSGGGRCSNRHRPPPGSLRSPTSPQGGGKKGNIECSTSSPAAPPARRNKNR